MFFVFFLLEAGSGKGVCLEGEWEAGVRWPKEGLREGGGRDGGREDIPAGAAASAAAMHGAKARTARTSRRRRGRGRDDDGRAAGASVVLLLIWLGCVYCSVEWVGRRVRG